MDDKEQRSFPLIQLSPNEMAEKYRSTEPLPRPQKRRKMRSISVTYLLHEKSSLFQQHILHGHFFRPHLVESKIGIHF